MRVRCSSCNQERDVPAGAIVFSPLRIPLVGYWLDCPQCGQRTRHLVLATESEDGAWLRDPQARKGE